MKHYLKALIICAFSFYVAYTLTNAVHFGSDPKNILFVVGGLFLISQVVRPIFTLVLLPLNLITFGLITLILNVAFFFALIKFMPGFTIGAYTFPGAFVAGTVFPSIAFNNVMTIILVATTVTLVARVTHLIFD